MDGKVLVRTRGAKRNAPTSEARRWGARDRTLTNPLVKKGLGKLLGLKFEPDPVPNVSGIVDIGQSFRFPGRSQSEQRAYSETPALVP